MSTEETDEIYEKLMEKFLSENVIADCLSSDSKFKSGRLRIIEMNIAYRTMKALEAISAKMKQ